MKSAYLINEDKKLIGKTVLNDDEEIPQGVILVTPPEYVFELEVPVWDDSKWKIEFTENGKKIAFEEARKKRNALLQSTDYTQLSDVTLTEEQKAVFRVYRQKLRDMFSGITNPKELIWPDVPALS